MKRKSLVLVLAALCATLVLGALSGCGKPASQSTSQPVDSKQAAQTEKKADGDKPAQPKKDAQDAEKPAQPNTPAIEVTVPPTEPVADGYEPATTATNFVDILMDDGQHIVIELKPDAAPLTVANFQKLVASGFYNGLTFHRVIDGFMIQGGDPEGTGMGGAKETIKGEFAKNGVPNPLLHKRGTVSMARSQDPNSASSQFFICNGDSKFLDGDYAAFGVVVSGMDEVDRIAKVEKGAQDRPVNPPVMKQVALVQPK